jgi:hypothetical protein
MLGDAGVAQHCVAGDGPHSGCVTVSHLGWAVAFIPVSLPNRYNGAQEDLPTVSIELASFTKPLLLMGPSGF